MRCPSPCVAQPSCKTPLEGLRLMSDAAPCATTTELYCCRTRSPCHNICTILTSIQSLLCDPNVASPANPEAASLYTASKQDYNRRVRRVAQRSVEC